MSKYESIKSISLFLFNQKSFSKSQIKLKKDIFRNQQNTIDNFHVPQKNENLNLEPMNCCSILKDHK